MRKSSTVIAMMVVASTLAGCGSTVKVVTPALKKPITTEHRPSKRVTHTKAPNQGSSLPQGIPSVPDNTVKWVVNKAQWVPVPATPGATSQYVALNVTVTNPTSKALKLTAGFLELVNYQTPTVAGYSLFPGNLTSAQLAQYSPLLFPSDGIIMQSGKATYTTVAPHAAITAWIVGQVNTGTTEIGLAENAMGQLKPYLMAHALVN